jgi:hypothetical protein
MGILLGIYPFLVGFQLGQYFFFQEFLSGSRFPLDWRPSWLGWFSLQPAGVPSFVPSP